MGDLGDLLPDTDVDSLMDALQTEDDPSSTPPSKTSNTADNESKGSHVTSEQHQQQQSVETTKGTGAVELLATARGGAGVAANNAPEGLGAAVLGTITRPEVVIKRRAS